MSASIVAFSIVLLGVVAYSWFLGIKQSKLTKSIEMLERIQKKTESHFVQKQRAA